MERQIWICACYEMPWIREERLQIGAFGLIKLAVLTSTSYNFNFHAPLFKEGGCIVNLIWLVSGYSRYKDRLFALKNGQNWPFLMWRPFSEAIFRQSFFLLLSQCNFIYNSNTYSTYSTNITLTFTLTIYLLIALLILTLLRHALLYNTILKRKT